MCFEVSCKPHLVSLHILKTHIDHYFKSRVETGTYSFVFFYLIQCVEASGVTEHEQQQPAIDFSSRLSDSRKIPIVHITSPASLSIS